MFVSTGFRNRVTTIRRTLTVVHYCYAKGINYHGSFLACSKISFRLYTNKLVYEVIAERTQEALAVIMNLVNERLIAQIKNKYLITYYLPSLLIYQSAWGEAHVTSNHFILKANTKQLIH